MRLPWVQLDVARLPGHHACMRWLRVSLGCGLVALAALVWLAGLSAQTHFLDDCAHDDSPVPCQDDCTCTCSGFALEQPTPQPVTLPRIVARHQYMVVAVFDGGPDAEIFIPPRA